MSAEDHWFALGVVVSVASRPFFSTGVPRPTEPFKSSRVPTVGQTSFDFALICFCFDMRTEARTHEYGCLLYFILF
jgi:hypothetical protein